jgi:hypothetical protein
MEDLEPLVALLFFLLFVAHFQCHVPSPSHFYYSVMLERDLNELYFWQHVNVSPVQ